MIEEAPIHIEAKDPTEITQATRDIVTRGRRITNLLTDEKGVLLITSPEHKKQGLGGMEIPNQTRPHRIYESLQPEEGPIDGVNRV